MSKEKLSRKEKRKLEISTRKATRSKKAKNVEKVEVCVGGVNVKMSKNLEEYKRIAEYNRSRKKTYDAPVVKESYYYVYVIKMDYGLVKIGISNDTKRRWREIQNASGGKIIEGYRINYKHEANAKNKEVNLHYKYREERKSGEFFKIDIMEVMSNFTYPEVEKVI